MSFSNWWAALFWQYVTQGPVFLACLIACLMVLDRRRTLGAGAGWAAAGFGLAAGINGLVPVTHMLIQRWMVEGYEPAEKVGKVYAAVGVMWACLHVVSYVLLLLAVLASRRIRAAEAPPLLPSRNDF